MCEEAPVRYDPDREVWDVFRYADVKTVLTNVETVSTTPRNATDVDEPEGERQRLSNETMFQQDPPRHDERRRVVAEAFHPRALRDLEPRIREVTTDVLDEACVDDTTEMVTKRDRRHHE